MDVPGLFAICLAICRRKSACRAEGWWRMLQGRTGELRRGQYAQRDAQRGNKNTLHQTFGKNVLLNSEKSFLIQMQNVLRVAKIVVLCYNEKM